MNKLRMLDLFSGIGGFSLAADWTGGIETVAFCEINKFCQKVLHKHWPDVPIFGDITKLDFKVEGICQCDQINKKQQTCETYNSPLKNAEQIELFGNVNGAENQSKCQSVSPTENATLGDSVRGSAGQKQCAETMGQIPVAATGCEEKTTQTTKTGRATSGTKDISKKQLASGDAECLRGTTTLAKNVDYRQTEAGDSKRTILKDGQIISTDALTFLMESLSVKMPQGNALSVGV